MRLNLLRVVRLRKRAGFRKIFEEGRFVANSFLAVHFLPNPEQSLRVGFSAGKKLGGAVVRNRCKRRMRECYRLHKELLPKGMDLIFVARRAQINARWETVVTAYLELLRRCREISEKQRKGK